MSSGDFYGPALPPGFTKESSGNQSAEILPQLSSSSSSRKRRHSSSSDSSSSSSSSHGSRQLDGDTSKLSEKEQPERLFGPALPVGYSSVSESISKGSDFIGPVLLPRAASASNTSAGDDDDNDVGPSPALNTESKTQSTVEQIELRAKQMKDKLEGKEQPDPASLVKKREDWMVELPPEMSKNFGVTARKFSTKTPTSTNKDRSMWTDTPADRARKEQEKEEGKVLKADVEEEPKVSAKDQRYREQVDEYNRLARPKSLLEMHEDKVQPKSHHKKKKKSKDDKEKKKKKKSKKKEGKEEKKVERRPFDRDKDLAVSRMDDAQRKSVIGRSKELGGRFGHGGTQFL